MKKPATKTIAVSEAIADKIKADAGRCGKKQYIHAGELIIDGFRYRSRRNKEQSRP